MNSKFWTNNYKNTWTISESGVSEIRLHFTKRELEYPDELKVLDKEGNRLETYTYQDNREDVWSEWYTGDTLKLERIIERMCGLSGILETH
jgi:hypothetical protein